MVEALSRHRDAIRAALGDVLSISGDHLDRVGAWGADFRERMLGFAARGKLIRGSLVAVGSEAFGCKPDNALYRVAAAIELVQSFLLVHDDIMDQDDVRRGETTIFAQYEELGRVGDFDDPRRFGESMGICAGDVAMLVAFEAIASAPYHPDLKVALISAAAREIADVGIAQMGDVSNGHSSAPTSEDEILTVYRYKTGRYTFSLPLTLGARIAGAPEEETRALGEWGELQGIIFQVRDDELGLFGTDVTTGKPVGTDIEADKKTLHRQRLFSAAPGTPHEGVVRRFGRPVNETVLGEVREALVSLGIVNSIQEDLDALDMKARRILDTIPSLSEEARSELRLISDYNLKRTA